MMPAFRSLCQFTWHHTCIYFLLMFFTISRSRIIPYSKECASIVPEAISTTYADFTFPYLQTSTSHFTGGEIIFGKNSSYVGNSLNFHTSGNVYATNINGVYKFDAELTFRGYNLYRSLGNSTEGRSSSRRPIRSGRLKFLLHGFWSESSGKGCLVGSASWQSSKGEPLNLEAMFKINYAKSSTFSTSFVTATLESLSSLNDENYFEPISILSFPKINQYEYKLLSEEIVRSFPGAADIRKTSVLGSQPGEVCSMFNRQHFSTFTLEYASKCKSSLKNCSPLDGVLGYIPPYVYLYTIQCYEFGNKMRVLLEFTNSSYIGSHQMFDPNTTLVGEGSWDESTSQLVMVACRIWTNLGYVHVGDCSFRLSLWFPAVWSIRSRIIAEGLIWTNKTAEDVGYFGKIKFKNSDDYMATVPGLKYKYSEIEKMNKFCPKKALKRGAEYPNGQSYDMRFDMFVKNSEYFGWGYVEPIFIGYETYMYSTMTMSSSRWRDYVDISESEVEVKHAFSDVSDNIPLNVSYTLILSAEGVKLGAGHSSLNVSLNTYGQLKISAEGVYDAGTGHLCMVGCRTLGSSDSLDCEILLNFQFPGSNVTTGGYIKGSMKSTRKKIDPLFFESLNMTSTSYSSSEALQSIWRMDLEIAMVLISNTLACIFVRLQIYYVKRYPNSLPFISLVMLVILTLGHMIPLVLNFEALLLKKQDRETIMLSTFGWLEANEVIVRVVTMVAFLLQLRLLQLAWTARRSGESNQEGISVAEKKALLVTLPIYIVGGLIAFLVSWKNNSYNNVSSVIDPWQQQSYKNASIATDYWQQRQQHSLWGDLRSYAGLVLDGFLFPQILLNIFQVSSQSALSHPFYLGTTLVRSVPHVYDLYRANNYVPTYVNGTYLYANPSADFYSTAWDIIIPFAGLSFAAIVFLQQKYGGRVILPRRFRELELYSKVPVLST